MRYFLFLEFCLYFSIFKFRIDIHYVLGNAMFVSGYTIHRMARNTHHDRVTEYLKQWDLLFDIKAVLQC